MKKLNSSIMYFLFSITIMALFCVRGAYGQSCSQTNPCVQVTITNTNPVPSPSVLWICVGMTTSNCTAAQLTAAQVGQSISDLCPVVSTGTGNWKCEEFVQTKTPQAYNDPHSWGSTINYAAQGTTVAEGVSATTPILTFQISAQTATPTLGTQGVVTTGTFGPQ